MHVLFISNLYPNPAAPNMAAFNRQQIAALSNDCHVDVIAPVPWPTGLQNLKLLKNRVESERIKVYHPIYYYTPRILRRFYGGFFYASIRALANRLLAENHFDLILSSWLYPDAWAAARLARKYNLPLVIKVHGSDVNLLKPGSALTIKSLEAINHAHKVVCVSRALRDRLLVLGAPKEKLEVIYNGIDRMVFSPMDRQAVRCQLQMTPDEFMILFVGNLKKEKGLGELISAVNQLQTFGRKNVKLVIIGSGSYKAMLEQEIATLGMQHQVRFLGSQPHAEIARWMNAASVLCLPSYMEGVPNVVLEALSCGTPVVASNVGGIPELIEISGGLLTIVEPHSVDQLLKALSVLKMNGTLGLDALNIQSWRENADALMLVMKYWERCQVCDKCCRC